MLIIPMVVKQKKHRMTSVEKYVVDSNANLPMIRFYIVFSSIKGDHKKGVKV